MKGTAGKEFDHLALRIDLEDIGLADLSFGDNFLEPLRLSEMEQQDAAGGLRLIDAGECWRLLKLPLFAWAMYMFIRT